MLKALLKCNTEPLLGVQDPLSIFLCNLSDHRFSFWSTGDVFCACGAEQLVGPVREGPIEDLDDEREFPEETGEETGSETRSVGVRCPVFDVERFLFGIRWSRKEWSCGELRVGTSCLGCRLALRMIW